jgi:hypothetical protein
MRFQLALFWSTNLHLLDYLSQFSTRSGHALEFRHVSVTHMPSSARVNRNQQVMRTNRRSLLLERNPDRGGAACHRPRRRSQRTRTSE